MNADKASCIKEPRSKVWEFGVEDRDGLWGGMRVEASNEREGREAVMRELRGLAAGGQTEIHLESVRREPPPPDYEAGASAVKRTRDADLRPFRRGFPAAGRDPFGSGP